MLALLNGGPVGFSAGSSAPAPVLAVVATTSGNVSWTPNMSAMTPQDLLIAVYHIYGRTGATETHLGMADPMTFVAEVAPGYEEYGVAVEIAGSLSPKVYSCVVLDSDGSLPKIHQKCVSYIPPEIPPDAPEGPPEA